MRSSPVATIRLALLFCGLSAGLMILPSARAQQFHAAVGGVTDYAVHGLSRTRGDPALQGELSLFNEVGTSIGAWASSVNLNPGPGATLEYALFVAQRFRANADVALDVRLSRYLYPDDLASLSYDYTELRAGLVFRDAVELAVAYSPDWSTFSRYYGVVRDRHAAWAELSAEHPVSSSLSLTGGIGYADISEHAGTGYTYFSAGVEWRWKRLLLGLSYVGTDASGERIFGSTRASDRFVGSVIWKIL